MATYLIDKNNVITVVRGDNLDINVQISKEESVGVEGASSYYIVVNPVRVTLYLMRPNQPHECAIIKKSKIIGLDVDTIDFSEIQDIEVLEELIYNSEELNPGDTVEVDFHFSSEETRKLFPGTYYYTIKCEELEGEINISEPYTYTEYDKIVSTVIPNTKFIVVD